MTDKYAETNAGLLERAAAGDDNARKELVVNNMGLVRSVIKRFAGRGHEAEDLFQIGCIGLIRAAGRFSTEYNVKFSTYAVPMIIGEIKRFIRDDGIIKVSRRMKETAAQAFYTKERIARETGAEPTISEIAKELNISASELAAALDSQIPPQSLFAVTDDGNGEGKALIERLEGDDDPAEILIDKLMLQQAVSDFPEREKQLIYLRYFKHKTQAQVSEKLGVSQVQISRLEKKILQKLRMQIEE